MRITVDYRCELCGASSERFLHRAEAEGLIRMECPDCKKRTPHRKQFSTPRLETSGKHSHKRLTLPPKSRR